MKYCNDKEKALIGCILVIAIVGIVYVNNRIREVAISWIDDITYDAKKRFVMKQCDECIEKADKLHKENTATAKENDITPRD